ncbi:MAG: Na+/H+ antiporter NhaC family protein [Vicinamibacterales bacterium]
MAASGLPPGPVLEFRAGAFGALTPFVLFLTGVGWLALAGAPDEHGFWPILLGALIVGLFLARDRTAYCDHLIAGMSQPIVMLMIMAWLLAGVIGTLMDASGFVDALVWAARQLDLTGGSYIVAAFLACCLVSTSTGTSFGTILICGPLLYPAGGPVAANPAMLAGAILAGSTFGDSISPISDTTIASSGTQGADIGGTVRSRLKYVLPAGAFALVVFALFGTASAIGQAAAPAANSPRGLVMLVAPAVVIALLLRGRHLVEGLLTGVAVSLVTGLGSGLLTWRQVVYIDAANFTAKGLVIDGLTRGLGVSVFTILLIGLVSTLKATGLVERLAGADRASVSGAQGAELRIFSAVSMAVLLTTHSVVAILTVGELANRLGRLAGLSAYRRANLLDVTVCTYPFLLPYFIPPILASSATSSGEAFGMPRVSPFEAGMYNVYSWALLAIVVVAMLTGYGRTEGGSGTR